ncbi:MAG: vWA domain-containing protein [Asticcacaulis sp.]
MRNLAFALTALLFTVAVPALSAPLAAPSVNTYILLDRTGSMSNIWSEALSSVNAYADGLATDAGGLKSSVTLAVFDYQNGLQFDVLRDHTAPQYWRNVTDAEASPRGMTPLYDAIGQMVSMAEKDDPQKAVLVIMTDGEENSSHEFNQTQARAALDRARAHGWEVVFLGAQFANFTDAGGMGVSGSQTMAVDKSGLTTTMQRLAKKSADYYNAPVSAPAPVAFDAEDRKAAKEDDVKKKTSGQP